MPRTDILDRLQKVFDEIFLEKVVVTPELAAADVDEWDSLLHVSLVLAIEQECHIRFRVGEVEKAKNVGELADIIAARMEKK